MCTNYIAYYNTSKRCSNLSFALQKLQILDWVEQRDGQIVAEFHDNYTKANATNNLLAAISACEELAATLVVFSLNKVAKNVSFLTSILLQEKVKVEVVGYPYSSNANLLLLANAFVIQKERNKHKRLMMDAKAIRGGVLPAPTLKPSFAGLESGLKFPVRKQVELEDALSALEIKVLNKLSTLVS